LYPLDSLGTVLPIRARPEKERLTVFHPVPHSDRWDPWMVILLFAVLAVAAGLTFILR